METQRNILPPQRSRSRAMTHVLSAAERIMTYPVTAISSAPVVPDLYHVQLSSERFADLAWQPGDKVDVQVGDLDYRAYTPWRIDRSLRIMDLLVFRHGNGRGSERLCRLEAGEALRLRGPKQSTVLDHPACRLFFFGDESSIGALLAHKSQDPEFRGEGSVLETFRQPWLCEALMRLELDACRVVAGVEGGDHLDPIARTFVQHLQSDARARLIATGRAGSIARLKKRLRAAQISGARVETHAFWAEGKMGLG